jgi:hypothetical protein
MPACFVAATNHACVVSMPGYILAMMQTELHTIATHDAAQIQVVKCRCRWREVKYYLLPTPVTGMHQNQLEPATEHTCMAGYSGPGPKAWIDQCSGDHDYYACSMRNCRTSTHIDFMLYIADQSPGSDPLKLFSLMFLHDQGIMALVLSMARERAQGGHVFIDVSTGSFATILVDAVGWIKR